MIGPFKIIDRKGNNAYKLDLPPSYQIHDVFHVNLLEKDATKGKPPLDVKPENAREEYIAEIIWDSRVFRPGKFDKEHPGGLYYLVHWRGELDSEDTWESASQLRHLRHMVREFHETNPDKPRTVWVKPSRKKK